MPKGGYFNNRHAARKNAAKMETELRADRVVKYTYAAIGLALYDKYKWEPDQIQELFTESQILWNSAITNGWDMLENAEEILDVEFKRIDKKGNVV